MSQSEAIANLGTIAKSGSQDFMNEVKDEHSSSAQSIIGQFGVGFYSVFMVADQVDVTSRRWDSDEGIHWTSSGDSGFKINKADNLPAGTRIELKLKPSFREYADSSTVKAIAQKYSSFTAFPLYCDEEHINQIEPIWMWEKNQITDEMHKTFYQHLSNDTTIEPRFQLFYKTDMPISVRSIFYIPMERPKFGQAATEDNKSEIALYCRKVLISNKTDMILPNWMRFVRGVVDSEDIPLNLSRELLQNTPLIVKIRETLTDRVIKFLNDRAKVHTSTSFSFCIFKFGFSVNRTSTTGFMLNTSTLSVKGLCWKVRKGMRIGRMKLQNCFDMSHRRWKLAMCPHWTITSAG